MFSKACEYGIRSAIYIAKQSILGKKVGIKEVSQEIDSPEAFTSKILQQLKKHQIIDSDKGPGGGFSMDATRLTVVTLKDIVYSIDGDRIYVGCGLGMKQCNASKPCPVHDEFAKIRDGLGRLLGETTVKALALNLQEGLSFLKV